MKVENIKRGMSRSEWKITCTCGHEGSVSMSENDAPYTKQWEGWSVSGFDGQDFQIDGSCNLPEAIKKLKPVCRNCGATFVAP